MIIKKKNNNSDNDENRKKIATETQQVKQADVNNAFDILTEATERQERRRGDRRRGYRRIEDRGLVYRAHEEAKIIKEQAAKDGFKNGLTKADSIIASLQETIASLLGVKEAAYNLYKGDIAIIAIQVAEKILHEQVKVAPDTIVEIAANVIKEISDEDSKITFVIHPSDELVLSENLATNSAFKNKKATMLIQTSDKIEKGSCKVITNSGQIDATFTSQIDIIRKAFKEGI